jgi:hypothetical protein
MRTSLFPLFFAIPILLAGAASGQTSTLASGHPEQGGGFGTVVASVPDVNGDGVDDVIVGAFGQKVGAILGAGRVTIHSGANGAVLRTLVSPNKQTTGWFGGAVAGVPDLTGDGRGDVVVGAYNELGDGTPGNGIGRVYVFNGATGQWLRTITSPNPEAGGGFGRSVLGLGDVTGDGRGDLVISGYREDPFAAPADAGRVYLYNGVTGALLRTFVSNKQATGGQFGIALAAVPDATGDGRPDLLIGANGEAAGNFAAAGRAHLYNPFDGAIIKTFLPGSPETNGGFGTSVAGVPDVNGDGRGDVIIGAPFEDHNAVVNSGRVYLFSGSGGAHLRTFFAGAPETGDVFGSSVAGVPDANSDSRGDVLIGAARGDPGGAPNDAGRAYLYSGASGAFLRAMNSPNQQAGATFGTSVAGLADTTGNGKGECIVGAPLEDTATIDDVGRAFIFRN